MMEEEVDSDAAYLNGRHYEQGQLLTSEYRFAPSKLTDLTLQHLAGNIDPKLLRFIQKRTAARCKRYHEAPEFSEDSKEIRQIYALYVLLFCMQHATPCSARKIHNYSMGVHSSW